MSSSEQLPVIRSIGRALPQNCYPQENISAALWSEWGGSEEGRARFERFHRSVGVRTRHLALPMEQYRELDSFSKTNDQWIERATDLGMEATESALAQAGLAATDVDHIFFTTVTGIASPSIDAKLVKLSVTAPTSNKQLRDGIYVKIQMAGANSPVYDGLLADLESSATPFIKGQTIAAGTSMTADVTFYAGDSKPSLPNGAQGGVVVPTFTVSFTG